VDRTCRGVIGVFRIRTNISLESPRHRGGTLKGVAAALWDMTDAGGRPCPLCQTPMFKRHCKYVCPQHGVVVDCSDPFTF
jgi:hypothetical protein